jgi:hypothetical protein
VIEGGEIGSGHSILAAFEIRPTEFNKDAVERDFSPAILVILKFTINFLMIQ